MSQQKIRFAGSAAPDCRLRLTHVRGVWPLLGPGALDDNSNGGLNVRQVFTITTGGGLEYVLRPVAELGEVGSYSPTAAIAP